MGKNSMRTINLVRNPIWADYAQTMVNVEVDFDELDEEFVPFTADPNDPEEHGRFILEQAKAGAYGPIADWVAPSNLVGDDAMLMLRTKRTSLLELTDYIEVPTKWATLTEQQQSDWTAYRNALRDLPETYPNAELHWNSDYTDLSVWVNVTWPTMPE